MTNLERAQRQTDIIAAYKSGERIPEIAKRFGIGQRGVQYITKPYRPVPNGPARSADGANSIGRHFRNLLANMMVRDGRNLEECEQCFSEIPEGKYQLHHTKYEGATYYDLQIVCQRCNLQTENLCLQ